MCKKEFDSTKMLIFNNEEFLNTINVDNENFYSDHLINSRYKLISTESLKNYEPKINGYRSNRLRKSSLDLHQIMRRTNSLDNSTSNFKKAGPLKILMLPKDRPPILPSMNGSK